MFLTIERVRRELRPRAWASDHNDMSRAGRRWVNAPPHREWKTKLLQCTFEQDSKTFLLGEKTHTKKLEHRKQTRERADDVSE